MTEICDKCGGSGRLPTGGRSGEKTTVTEHIGQMARESLQRKQEGLAKEQLGFLGAQPPEGSKLREAYDHRFPTEYPGTYTTPWFDTGEPTTVEKTNFKLYDNEGNPVENVQVKVGNMNDPNDPLYHGRRQNPPQWYTAISEAKGWVDPPKLWPWIEQCEHINREMYKKDLNQEAFLCAEYLRTDPQGRKIKSPSLAWIKWIKREPKNIPPATPPPSASDRSKYTAEKERVAKAQGK